MKNKMKQVLIRYYSQNNLGDDLFVQIVSNRYKNNFHLISRFPNKTFKQIPNITQHGNLFAWIFFRAKDRIRKSSMSMYRSLAAKSDVLVYVGGSIFIEKNNLSDWVRQRDFYRDLKIPYYFIGCNFGPFTSPEFPDVAENIIANSEDTCFRDEVSYQRFSHLPNTRQTTDLAFTLVDSKYASKPKDSSIVISLMDLRDSLGSQRYQEYLHLVRQQIMDALDEGLKITLMSFCERQGDSIAIQDVLSSLPTHSAQQVQVFRYNGDLEDALYLIGRAKFVIGTRFHAVILGLALGARVLPLMYSQKTNNLLNDFGFDGPRVELYSHKSSTFSATATNKFATVDSLRDLKSLANQSFKGLDVLLTPIHAHESRNE